MRGKALLLLLFASPLFGQARGISGGGIHRAVSAFVVGSTTGTSLYKLDVYGTNALPQVHVAGEAADTGFFLQAYDNGFGNGFDLMGDLVWDNGASAYRAKATSVEKIGVGGGAFKFSSSTAGVVGNTITPTLQFFVSNTGVTLAPGTVYRVASDFTTSNSTGLQTISGLLWALPASTAANYPFHCEILYKQTVAAVADAFGIQSATQAPTNIMAKGWVQTAAAVTAYGNLPTLNTTTATNIVTFTPSAITTVWQAHLDGMIENPSGAANTINVMVSQSTGADLIVVLKGSYCVVGF